VAGHGGNEDGGTERRSDGESDADVDQLRRRAQELRDRAAELTAEAQRLTEEARGISERIREK
jgi:hypothetical protein